MNEGHPEPQSARKLTDALRQLAQSIKQAAERGISDGSIRPEVEMYFRWKIDKFLYTDKGITESGAHGEYIFKRSWLRGAINLRESLRQSAEYFSALEHLTAVFGKSDRLSQSLERFTDRAIHQRLYESKLEEAEIEELLTTFLKDLREEPLKYSAEVELQGIILKPENVIPEFGVTLRQPRIEDLEKEFPVYGLPMAKPFHPHPSAILKVEFLGRGASETQSRVEQAVVILRLFKVGGVKWDSYRMYSDSITDMMASATLGSGKGGSAFETYLLTEQDVPRLKKFWQTMASSMPKSLFTPGITRGDHVTISYNRYSDALLENGSLERRIANAVMGLEALLLRPGEAQELVYRLSLRLSKLLGLLGFNPYEAKRIVSDAYKVRNLFAHGGQLSYSEKKRLDARYGDVHSLLMSVLNYLRVLLIVMMLNSREKEEFIDVIEDSFLDRKREEELVGLISGAKQLAVPVL